MTPAILLDCTFRDGGYYTAWDFSPALIADYIGAMKAARVNVVELGFRFLDNDGFKGACAYTTDDFIRSLDIPKELKAGVMVNGSDLLSGMGLENALARLFPETAETSPVALVRVACHFHEFERVLPAAEWLSRRGYKVGFNLMQIAGRSGEEIRQLAAMANGRPIEVLYFADSTGSLQPSDVDEIVGWLRAGWHGPLGIHTHDNMGLALQNTLRAHANGVTWLDATVTGMGRGPGNARTEELLVEMDAVSRRQANLVPLLTMIRRHFKPLKEHHGWGSNPFYYLAGKYGIHPSYIQEMQDDARYGEEDILAVIESLRRQGAQKFRRDTLDSARNFYGETPNGSWSPATVLQERETLLLGSGPGITRHRLAIEAYIRRSRPVVIALNTQSVIDNGLIDLRVACHPIRLLADCETHAGLPQPLIAPVSGLPGNLREALQGKALLDFGLGVKPGVFSVSADGCIVPNSLVMGYALAVASSGRARRILLAGFDSYPPGDSRNHEIQKLLNLFASQENAPALLSVTETAYDIDCSSIYGI